MHRKGICWCWVALIPLLMGRVAFAQTIWYVRADSDCTQNCGDSWEDAFKYLREALIAAYLSQDCTVASPCEVWVAEGIYRPDESQAYPTGTGDRGASFTLRTAVRVFGGFTGEETRRAVCVGGQNDGTACLTPTDCPGGACQDRRHWERHETILSGDLEENDETTECSLGQGTDCSAMDGACDAEGYCRETSTGRILTHNADNSTSVVTTGYGAHRTATGLDGFTITGGNNDTEGETGGGGIQLGGADATFRNCVITINQADGGGGGVYSFGTLNSRFIHCTISENWAGHGGGVGAKVTVSPEFVNCIIVANRAENSGAGMHLEISEASNPKIYDTVIVGNVVTAYSGGWCGGVAFWVDRRIPSTLSIANSTIAHNYAQYLGGGLYVKGDDSARVEIDNSIVWANEAGYGQQIYIDRRGKLGPRVVLQYSDVRRFEPSDIRGDVVLGEGNKGTQPADDPLFVDPESPVYHFSIQRESPCIDAASNPLVPEDETDLDQDGNTWEKTPWDVAMGPRHLNDLTVPNTGVGPPPVVDMGAYEFAGQINDDDCQPPPGVIDARQPHPPSDCSLTARQGFGYGDEPITITFDPLISGADDVLFWNLFESGIERQSQSCLEEEPPLEPNEIATVSYVEYGKYKIELERPISAGFVTTISLGEDHSAIYASLPADVSSDCTSGPPDILYLIDCLNGVRTCEIWQCDMDRVPPCLPPDMLRLFDLHNGAGLYTPWLNMELDPNICQGGGESATGGGSMSSGAVLTGAEANAEFIDGFVNYVTTAVITDAAAEKDFKLIVEALTGFCVDNLSGDERATLADKIQDPSLKFESPVAEDMVPEIVNTLLE